MQIEEDEGALFEVEGRLLYTRSEDSMAYDSGTKLALTRSLSSLCGLAASLRQTLEILSLHPADLGSMDVKSTLDRVQACSERLDHWFAGTKASCHTDGLADDAVMLHNNVTYIYYQ